MTSTNLPRISALSRPLLSLSAALALAACTLPIKLAELSAGEETTDSASSGFSVSSGSSEQPTSGASDGESSAGGSSCKDVLLMGTPLSPNVVLVLDKSGSMVYDPAGLWDHDDDPGTAAVTRWSSLHEVVEALVTDFDDSINFGAHLVPGTDATSSFNANGCLINANVDIAVAATNKAAILAGIPAANEDRLRGGTPIAAGLTTAIDHLKTLDPYVPRAIVLVTDGAANCTAEASVPELFEVYDESVHVVVDDAFSVDDIPTYVVGVGIEDIVSPTALDGNPDATNTFDRLNDLASEGGKPRSDPDQKFYNTTNQIELAAALGEIALDALTCIIPLDAIPSSPEGTAVVVGGTPILQVSDCATENGWMYTHPEGPFDAIKLCGSACAGLKLVGQAEISVCTPE